MKYLIEAMEQLIKTYDGTPAIRKECRFIKGNFYIKNKQCFLINDKWYRVNSGYIFYDYEYNLWKLLNNNERVVEGIVDWTWDEGITFGKFTSNRLRNTKIFIQGKLRTILSIDIVNKIPNIAEGLNGYYYCTTEANIPKEFNIKLKPRKDNYYSFPLNYNSDNLIAEFSKYFKENFVGDSLLSDNYKLIEKLGFTFGVEFETEKGAIPENLLKPNGLIACKDGSISGFEYVTIPLFGKEGIQAIKKNCKLLFKYCSCSPLESLHIHLGGYPKTVKGIVSIFRLGQLIEDEIYKLFPYYYVDTSNFKRKSYCNPLPNLGATLTDTNEIFKVIYHWLSSGNEFSGRFPTGQHPLDRDGQHKWEVNSRYYWLNLVPLLWGKKETIEFRCHVPTMNDQKVINWIYITMAILAYAKKYQTLLGTTELKDISPINLKIILTEFYPDEVSNILIRYIEERKKHYSKRQDNVGEAEILMEHSNKDLYTLTPFV